MTQKKHSRKAYTKPMTKTLVVNKPVQGWAHVDEDGRAVFVPRKRGIGSVNEIRVIESYRGTDLKMGVYSTKNFYVIRIGFRKFCPWITGNTLLLLFKEGIKVLNKYLRRINEEGGAQ